MTNNLDEYDMDGASCINRDHIPEINFEKVLAYVKWKKSWRHRVSEYILGPHWLWMYTWKLYHPVFRFLTNVHPKPPLNYAEKIRVGLLLRQAKHSRWHATVS